MPLYLGSKDKAYTLKFPQIYNLNHVGKNIDYYSRQADGSFINNGYFGSIAGTSILNVQVFCFDNCAGITYILLQTTDKKNIYPYVV
ncbi:hypothetical protein [Lactobacillus sp. ESL0677]|uniref:hypothetical protein n=1 Tax=Lactobacillus sp. ESL0677 TaxID=2983208 RepID=UPI0023F6DF32|nr:hypothetical protein [Lactobacillus sp. ESL0677]WEV36206.1 hypothetical protein OZX76_05520 [Lactobacillus sp. ESL0677]